MHFSKYIIFSKIRKITFLFFGMFVFSQAIAQQPNDSVMVKTAIKQIGLKTPESIAKRYTYDPLLHRYVYTEKIGKNDLKTPMILTVKEYEALVMKEQMAYYFREKSEALSGSKGEEEKKKVQRDLLPDFYVNSDFFESIFGGKNIDLIPQGSVGVDLGVRYTKNDNPAMTPRNRVNWGLDFDQVIRLGLTGNIGTKLSLNAQYDTQATFDFQNVFKLEYEPNEDDILQKVELGNISMPMSNSLITGSQSLFGVKTELKFGRTTITGVFSEQKSERRTVTAQGGGTLTEFEITALDYDENRNFFLAQFFRDQYDKALENYPFINSKVQITRLEVWVTNRNNRSGNIRNILALQDLGESKPENTRLNLNAPAGFFRPTTNAMPTNAANNYDPTKIKNGTSVLTSAIRDVATVSQGFGTLSGVVNQGHDYAIIENARKLEEGTDYRVDTKLGYISLSTTLSSDEVLAVAYQYTYGGEVFQVGEFANDGISATTVNNFSTDNAITNNLLVLKMLKSNRLNTKDPIWHLMMKNVYSLGVLQLDPQDFRMNVYYADPSPINYISAVDPATWPTGLDQKILLHLFNFDRLNKYNDPQPGGDGFFDFIPGITIDEQYGRIIFTKVEPFGEFLHKTLGGGNYKDPSGYNANQKKYVYPSLYANTKVQAQMDSDKNKFQLKGRFKSSGRKGISLGAFNVPQGSVRVTAGGRILVEGIDYVVNYQSGTVEIINAGLEASNIPIQVSVENNLIFGGQTTRFMAVNVEHKFNDKFVMGASVVNLRERPYTQKSSYGQESVNNTIFGFGGNYATELPFLTRWVNRIPTIKTDVASNLAVRGEFAYLIPGTPKGDNFEGETTVYLDDFETSQYTIDVRSPLAWKLASTPLEFGEIKDQKLYGNSPDDPQNLRNGYGRAKLAWYTIDPIFYTTQKPSDISSNEISKNSTRRIYIEELFPEQQVAQGQSLVQTTLDLAYYPNRKGPYNDNPSYAASTANDKWGGIMRGMTYSDFQETNVEYIQFWMMDPYASGEYTGNGELVFNLGNISEDVLKDGRKQYENGLPGPSSTTSINTSSWGKVPAAQSLLYAFDANNETRRLQDVGLDGVADTEESVFYKNNALEFPNDPALDNYEFYLAKNGKILDRYLNYNGLERNSPIAVSDNDRGATTLPDYEDVDGNYTMNTENSYYEYRLPIKPNIQSTDPYVNDIRNVSVEAPNGQLVNTRWIQFKIPIRDGKSIGGIADFNSITHMRMYMTGFEQEMLLRFGTLDLVRGDWRNFNYSLSTDMDDPADDNTYTEINSVNIIENEKRVPIPYRMPPGVYRERINTNNTLVDQNEQSLSLIVCDLEPYDSRAVYKNMNVDLRQYKYIKMFVHAEQYKLNPLANGQVSAFIRIGTDFRDNYYQVEIPLTVTPAGASSEQAIWPNENQIQVPMEMLTKLKSVGIRNQTLSEVTFYDADLNVVTENTPLELGKNRYSVKGNPSLGSVRAVMIGIKNHSTGKTCGEFWFNELRLSELVNNGGWAAVAALDANAADLMNISATGKMSTVGFGPVDQTPNQRAIEAVQEYDVMVNVNAGKLLPEKWKIEVPVNLNHSQKLTTPEFDPVYQDLKLKDRLDAAQSQQERNAIKDQAESFTLRRGINLIGVKKGWGEQQKKRFYNVENFTFNYAYNEVNHRDYELEYEDERNVKTGVLYNHAFQAKSIEPFKNSKRLSGKKYWQWLTDVNLNLLPASVMFSSNITRSFTKQLFRDVYLEGVNSGLQRRIPELQQRNYMTDYQYAINYNLTRSLRLNFNAANSSIVRNYYDYDATGELFIRKDVGLWDNFWDMGDPNHFYSNFQLNYELPLNKIPFLSFVRGSYTYNGDFDWQRGSEVLINLAGHEINTLQNANTHNFTANLAMDQFYAYLGIKNGGQKKNLLTSLATMVKRIDVNYSETNGQMLPGYIPRVGFFGTAKPSLGFMFGDQTDIRNRVAERGYLTTFADFNEQYTQSAERQLNIVANLQPLPDLQIDLKGERQYTDNYTETFEIEQLANTDYRYKKLIGNQVGNFKISTNILATSFSGIDEYHSDAFETFKENRKTVARRLAATRGIDLNNPANFDADGFPIGYGKNSQAVMMPAFVAAYSGTDAANVSLNAFRKFPIPGWNIRYTGLMRLEAFKNIFRRFSLSHGYTASYSLNEFRTNLEYDAKNISKTDASGNFLNENLFSTVNLVEQFTPLIRVDMEMKNSVNAMLELRRDRTISISLDNDYLTEIFRKEYKVGLGYRFKNVGFATRINGVPTTIKSDLILKADVSYLKEFTVIRNMEIYNHQVTAGQNSWVARMSAEYALSRNLLASYYFNYNFSKSAISTAFPMTTIRTGISVKYTFN
ncbi:T9SS outer membrane translocon Sov/SprA [Capnocytophaga canimorsus]|uniref:T9SS outer membrane translocon Sov/SprA n=1 Tax=Capnocytophaga canimorsus TaxID=28188 RepID=UPI0038589ECF